MGEAYGKTPEEMMGMNLTPAESFWFNSDAWAAVQKYRKRMKEARSRGTASSESQELAAEQEQRAAQELAAPEDQMERLEEIRQMQVGDS